MNRPLPAWYTAVYNSTQEVDDMDKTKFGLYTVEAQNYETPETFIAATDPDSPEELAAIWVAAHRTMKEIAADAGLSQRKLAEHFGIPYRTMEDWCRGARACPVYVRVMMQECLGLIRR